MANPGGHRILAIDQGTSGTKAIVINSDGVIESLAEVPIRPVYGSGSSVEQDPVALLASVREAGRAAIASAGGAIDAVTLANQGETVLAWDPASGEPLTPAIVWQDGRSQEVCDEMQDEAEFLAARTGLVLDPYFTAPKMAWLRRHLTREGVVTTTDTWIVHALTGEFVTDVTTASRSLLLDVDTCDWGHDLLDAFGLGSERLPRLVRCDEVVGTTSAFGPEVPVTGLIVDQQAALLAESCFRPGQAKCTYGTGAFVLANVGETALRSRDGLTTSVAWATREGVTYCVDGQVFTVASALRWLTDVGLLDGDVDSAVAEDSGGVLCSPALAGLGAPWWRSDAQASFTGLSLSTTRGNLVRAVVEGVAAQVRDLVMVMAGEAGLTSLRVDGGLTQSAAFMQIQADLVQRPVEVYPSPHATALGTAALGRMALSPGMLVENAVWEWSPARVFEPRWSPERAEEHMDRWRRTLTSSLGER